MCQRSRVALSELTLHTLSARALPDLAPRAITQTDPLSHTGLLLYVAWAHAMPLPPLPPLPLLSRL